MEALEHNMDKMDNTRRQFIAGLTLAALVSPALAAETSPIDPEETAIRATALDYIQGWYTGDAERMERALHPELAKRVIMRKPGKKDQIEQQSALTLILKTRAGIGKADPHPRGEFRLIDRFENAAVARIDASDWVDYLQLGKWQGQWKIVNVLWEFRPGVSE